MKKIALILALMLLLLVPGAAKASHTPTSCSAFVCATALATGATIICDTSSIGGLVHVLTCKGVVALGGHGDSTGGLAGLPGYMSWSGHASCGLDCSGSSNPTGFNAWGGLGDNGSGSTSVVEFPTVQKYDYNPFCCETCIDYSVSGFVNVDSYAAVLGVVLDHASSNDSDSAGVHHCY